MVQDDDLHADVVAAPKLLDCDLAELLARALDVLVLAQTLDAEVDDLE